MWTYMSDHYVAAAFDSQAIMLNTSTDLNSVHRETNSLCIQYMYMYIMQGFLPARFFFWGGGDSPQKSVTAPQNFY